MHVKERVTLLADKAAIVLESGGLDKLYAASVMISGAAAIGMEVHLFVTFSALLAFKKENIGKLASLPPDLDGEARERFIEAVQSGKMPSWYQTLQQAKMIGDVHIQACGLAMDLFHLTLDDLVPEVEGIMGVTGFMALASEAKVTLYI